jgi:hypothetical protein
MTTIPDNFPDDNPVGSWPGLEFTVQDTDLSAPETNEQIKLQWKDVDDPLPSYVTVDSVINIATIDDPGAAAPADAQYWVAAVDAALPNAKNLSGITGLVKSTAGTPSAATAGTDYLTPAQVNAQAIVFAIALG